jgi:hypothetical protein
MSLLRRSAIIAAILATVVAGTAAADTNEGEPFDNSIAAGRILWTDPTSGTAYEAEVSVWRDHLADAVRGSMSFYLEGNPQACDELGVFWVDATGSGAGATYAAKNNHSTASGSATVSGAEMTILGCGDEVVGPTRTFSIALDLTATGRTDRTNGRSVEVTEDGTKVTRHYAAAFAPAAGTIVVDGVSHEAFDARIGSTSMTVRSR